MSDNRVVLQEKFEQCLLDGLAGQVVITKKGDPLTDPETGEFLKAPPDSSFLSVVRAYLKDLTPADGKPRDTAPATGKSQGLLAEYERRMGSLRPN